MWLAATVMAALAGTVLFACTVANGLHVPDRSPDASVAPDAGDGCDHKGLPPKPTEPDGNNGKTYLVAFEEIYFGKKDAGGPPSLGIDLDGICTCTNGAGTSCTPVHSPDAGKSAPNTYCDGPRGQDNAMGVYGESVNLNSGLISFSLAPFINSKISQGLGGVLLAISSYSGDADDANVSAYFIPSHGAFRSVDAGPDADGGSEFVGREDAGKVWSFDPHYVIETNGQQGTFLLGYVKDYTFVAPLQGHVNFAGLDVDFTEGWVIAKLVMQDDGDLRIDDGVIVGRWPIDSLATSVAQFSVSLGTNRGAICTNYKDLYETKFLPGLCGAADVRTTHDEDNKNLPCDALSLALGFRALPAVRGDPVPFEGLADCSEAGLAPLECR